VTTTLELYNELTNLFDLILHQLNLKMDLLQDNQKPLEWLVFQRDAQEFPLLYSITRML